MNQSQQIIESLVETEGDDTAKTIGVATDRAQADDVIRRQGIDFDKASTSGGVVTYMADGEIIGKWDMATGTVSRFRGLKLEAEQVQVGDEVKVNIGKAKAGLPGDFGTGHVMKILRKTIKNGGGTVTVYRIVGTDAHVAGETAALLGTVMVPIAALTVVRAK